MYIHIYIYIYIYRERERERLGAAAGKEAPPGGVQYLRRDSIKIA